MKLDATWFLNELDRAVRAKSPPADLTPGNWTYYMTGRLLALANSASAHVCSRTLGQIPAVGQGQHESQEYLFDFTLYEKNDWRHWSLPSVIIEHENQWSEREFLVDFWKVLVGFAPLRVMFGYTKERSGTAGLANTIDSHASTSRWRYPVDVEDLVLLRAPEMTWPHWTVLYRANGKAWATHDEVDLATLRLP